MPSVILLALRSNPDRTGSTVWSGLSGVLRSFDQVRLLPLAGVLANALSESEGAARLKRMLFFVITTVAIPHRVASFAQDDFATEP